MIRRSFEFPAEDGEVIRGDLRLPAGESARTAVLVAHGFKGFKDWGFFPHLCEVLALDGHAVVSFNFSRNGVGDDLLTFSRLESFEANTLSREVRELLQLLEAIRDGTLLDPPPERIGVIGHSRGGGISILGARGEAERGGRLSALVTWAAVAEFGRWSEEQKEEWRSQGRIYTVNSRTGQQLPLGIGLLDDFEANRVRLDVERAAAELTLPWLVIHGETDTTVGLEDARRLGRANPKARVETIPASGHTFEARHPFDGSNPTLDHVIDLTRDHFRRHLSGEGGPGVTRR